MVEAMKKVYAKHLPYTNGHYADVYHEMTLNDGPIIRAVKVGDDYCAIEGSHRIAACHDLGKDLRLLVVTPDAKDGLDDSHWNAIKSTLPCYEFEHVFVMNEGDWFKPIEHPELGKELSPETRNALKAIDDNIKHALTMQHLLLMD